MLARSVQVASVTKQGEMAAYEAVVGISLLLDDIVTTLDSGIAFDPRIVNVIDSCRHRSSGYKDHIVNAEDTSASLQRCQSTSKTVKLESHPIQAALTAKQTIRICTN